MRALTRPFASPVVALGLLSGCNASTADIPPERLDAGADVQADVAPDVRPPPAPTVVGVQPSHGSFLGGTEVVVRGSNFTEESVVRFGGNLVQPRYTSFVDRNRIAVRTPAGRAGEVDVQVEVGGRVATLPGGYRYDAFYVDPAIGPTTGGARVSIHGLGTHFRDGMRVTFDELPCTELTVTGPELASCLTPAHPDGRAGVAVDNGEEQLSVPDGYTYADGGDTNGGLSGGSLAGSLTVTVLSLPSGNPIPSAFVFLNDEPGAVPPNAGRTNARGQVTLSPAMLRAPVTVTASERCHTTTTIQSFDARNATIYLTGLMLPGCGMGSPGGMAQRPVYPAILSGELVWQGPNEFAPNAWSNVPEPREGFHRVAYVWTSRDDIFTPDPVGPALVQQRDEIREIVVPGHGGRGYPFSLQARPAAVAVYALAGLESDPVMAMPGMPAPPPPRFIPWVMGVARSVLGAPRAEVDNIVIDMNIPLDHETPLDVAPLGSTAVDAPDQFHASAFVDLGGEGVIPLPHATVTGFDGGTYRLSGLPAFNRNLADARLTVHARLASGPVTGPTAFQDTPAPCTGLVIPGITSPDETVRVGGWLGIPELTNPRPGDRLPTDRTVRFDIPGSSPDLLIFQLQWEGRSWQHYAPGAERSVRYPDLSSLMGLADMPPGSFLGLSLVALRLSSFDFDRFTYTTIGPRYWTAYAGRGSYLTR